MKPFQQYLTEERISGPHGIFVKLTPTVDSILALVERFPEMNCDDPHCTLIYTHDSFHDIQVPEIARTGRWKGIGKELEWFEGATKIGFVILHVESPEIRALQKKFFEAGFPERSDFDEYKPHVSLIFPAPKAEWDFYIQHNNHVLQHRPLELEFFYGGYQILEENTPET